MKHLQGNLIRPTTMQEHNAYVVLQLIKQQNSISRADIARALGFSKSAISAIVSFLTTEELITVVGKGNPKTGRKSELLSFDPSTVYHVGVDLRWNDIYIALIDLAGTIVAEENIPLGMNTAPEAVVESIIAGYEAVCSTDSDRPSPKGIGVMIPGVVDSENGQVIYSSNLRWEAPVALAELLFKRIGIPAYLENDANALALAEAWVGHGDRFGSIVYLFLEHGLGGAFVSRAHVFRGSSFAGVEAGKTLVCPPDEQGPRSVESALSVSRLTELFGPADYDSEDLHEYLDLLRADPSGYRTREIVVYLTEILGQLGANLIALFNPEAIFLDTPFLTVSEELLPRLSDRVRGLLPLLPLRDIRIFPASLRREERVIGGAAIAIYRSRFRFLIAGRIPLTE